MLADECTFLQIMFVYQALMQTQNLLDFESEHEICDEKKNRYNQQTEHLKVEHLFEEEHLKAKWNVTFSDILFM